MKSQTTEEGISLRSLRWVELTTYPSRIKVPYFVRKGVKRLENKVCTVIGPKKGYLLVQSSPCPHCKCTYGSLAWIGTDLAFVCGGFSCLNLISE